jgi:hypothetical protein
MPHAGICGALAAALLAATGASPAADWLTDEAAATGLDFRHWNGMSGALYSAEIMAPGAGFVDYDGDGDLDVFLVQGDILGPGKTWADATFPPPPGAPRTHRLYRNDLAETGRLAFTDVTARAGITLEGYGMGVATGDYDNDGDPDLYVTGFRRNHLLRNDGDGTFTDVTAAAGAGDPRWSVSAAFVDFDRDGWLDLYVGNYVEQDLARHEPCRSRNSARDYCTPLVYPPLPDRLLRNRGDGTFEDVTAAAGLAGATGTGLGVVAADLTGDGWPDLYVANDAMANHLWVNQGDGTFVDDAYLAGAAVNMEGAAEASMGVDAADFDGDGDEDLFMTHLQGETNTLYVNDGTGWFEDRTLATGLAAPSRPYTAFGTAWIDIDNDGWLDLYTANGDITFIRALMEADDPFPLHQPNQLFRNRGDGTFEDVSDRAGAVMALSEVSRGAAFGDVDNDGDMDILVANNNAPVRLLINRLGSGEAGGAWLGLRLVDRRGLEAVGARVELLREGRPALWRRARTDGSYASANDPRVLIGLGADDGPQRVRVHWPDGTVEAFDGLTPGAYATLRQGEGGAP